MLNELADLHRSLVEGGIEFASCHPWVKPLGHAEALTLYLSADGSVARVALIPEEVAVSMRRISPHNHESFPAFNLKCPLRHQEAGPGIALDEAQRLIRSPEEVPYPQGQVSRVERILQEYAVKTLQPLLQGHPGLESTQALLDRVKKRRGCASGFLREVAERILTSVQCGDLEIRAALDIVFGKWNSISQQREGKNCTVFLDVDDVENFPRSVSDPATAAAWSRALLCSQPRRGSETPIKCALRGQVDSPLGDKMPEPILPVIGQTYLMSMNVQKPCQVRYGLTGTDVFRIGLRSAHEMNDAILHITNESRKHMTWGGVPNGQRKGPDLLIAFVEEDPGCQLEVVGLFSDEAPSAEDKAATFEARTANILDSLEPQGSTRADRHVRVFALSKIDPGRKQVIFSDRYTGGALVEGRNRWVEGSRNLPSIQIETPARRGKKAEWRRPSCPSPSEAMIAFKRQWSRDVTRKGDVPGVDLRTIYELYLAPDPSRVARWLISRFLPLVEPLLLVVGARRALPMKSETSAKNEALKAAALLGILLLAQGRRKEQYMESREFLLGRFLQLADQLHKAYCEEVRKGDIPPQLIGNAAVTMAMERPARALEMLAGRMAVYLAWSDRFKGEKAGLVRWFRKELGDVALKLREQDLSQRVSTNGRAEVLLGYLASTRKTEGEEQNQ